MDHRRGTPVRRGDAGVRPAALAGPAGGAAAVAYALWATANVVLFPLVEGVPAQFQPWMYAMFAVPGIAVPWLAVWTVWGAGAARRA